MNSYLKIAGTILLALTLASCGGSKEQQKTTNLNTFEVKPQAFHKTLHFTGTIQPLRESTLTCPMEAVVETMHFHYGQMVKKGFNFKFYRITKAI
jgi:HlyD family secretion protein